MQLLKPGLISGEILTLLDEVDKKAIIVSPYVKIDKWHKLLKRFESLKQRNIEIEFYIREDKNNIESFEQVKNLGFTPIGIPDLHTKLYMNEKTAIVTSMNLLLSSEINSLDIGYKTETAKEYNELLDYYNRYIKKIYNNSTTQYTDWRDKLYDKLTELFGQINMNGGENKLLIQTNNNNYELFIAHLAGKNALRISGILTSAEYNRALDELSNLNTNSGIKFELASGRNKYYDSIWSTLAIGLKSTSVDYIFSDEQETAITNILKFISTVERIKISKKY